MANNTQELEPWVDIKAVSAHTGISKDKLVEMAEAKEIPSYQLPGGGKRVHRRFKLSMVDAALRRKCA